MKFLFQTYNGDCAGRFSISVSTPSKNYYFHLLPHTEDQRWGYRNEFVPQVGFLPEFGIGPLLLVCWDDFVEDHMKPKAKGV